MGIPFVSAGRAAPQFDPPTGLMASSILWLSRQLSSQKIHVPPDTLEVKQPMY